MSEITNEEHRKVAEIMRGEAQLWHILLPGAYINRRETSMFFQDIMHFVGINGRPEPEAIYNRLADLIDRPTCRIIKDVETPEHPWGTCSRCSALVDSQHATSSATEYLPTRFCPNCGAEVVE